MRTDTRAHSTSSVGLQTCVFFLFAAHKPDMDIWTYPLDNPRALTPHEWKVVTRTFARLAGLVAEGVSTAPLQLHVFDEGSRTTLMIAGMLFDLPGPASRAILREAEAELRTLEQ